MMQIHAKAGCEVPDSVERRSGSSTRAKVNSRPRCDFRALLRQAGLRPTRQRMALTSLLFSMAGRHVTAQILHDEAIKAKAAVSLATVYNTLHQLTDAQLLRQIGVDGVKSFFDIDLTEHHHFFLEGEDVLVDIPKANVVIEELPQAPDGFEIARVDVVVHLRGKQR